MKRPELKMPELKVPMVLSDLYWDLRDRRLLPLVALAIVAIVAVPFLLGGGSKEPPPVAPVVSGALQATGDHGATLTVVQAKPGLRDYRKRLARRSPTDPFKQRYTGVDLTGAKLGGGEKGETSSTSTSTSTSKTTEETKSTTEEVTVDTSNGSGGAPPEHLTLYSFAADIKITRTETKEGGGKETSKPTVRHRVVPPTMLPSAKEPLVTYMGINPKTKLPLLLVSDGVTGVFGDAKCLSGEATCQLLEVETGLPMTFALDDGVRYKINVLKVEAVTSGKY